MFDNFVAPLLRVNSRWPRRLSAHVADERHRRIPGAGKIAAPLGALVAAGLEVGYCARAGAGGRAMSARGAGGEKVVHEAEAIVQKFLARRLRF